MASGIPASGSPGGAAPSPTTNSFNGCTITSIYLLLAIIGVVCASISALLNSAFVGAFIIALFTIGSCIVPIILWLIDKTNPKVDVWLQACDSRLEMVWKKWAGSAARLRISQTTIRLCSIILLLCASIAGSLIYPSVPQFVHNILFPICGICVEPKTGVGISEGQYHFWQENGPDNPNKLVDVESLIYDEDQQIMRAHLHHITLVLVTTLAQGGRHLGIGYDDLQAVYVLQHEANQQDGCPFQDPLGCLHIRLLVANAGDNMEDAPIIAQQIIQIESSDPTFLGVVGWPLSRPESIDGVRTLSSKNILAISATASSDALTAISPSFFRVAPVDSEQGPAAAQYAISLGAHKAAVFYTPDNPYSLTLATSFIQTFIKRSGNRILNKTYRTDSKSTDDQRNRAIHDDLMSAFARSDRPDLIYFAGYSDDFNKLLTMLRKSSEFHDYNSLPIISGDGAYDLSGYTGSNYQNISFTAFASPDEWGVFPDPCVTDTKRPATVREFFCDYAQDFDPDHQHPGTYGFSRTDSAVMLTYDAATILVQGYLATHETLPKKEDIQRAIQDFSICKPWQGVSGQIAFGPDNNPLNKAFVLLKVDYVSPNKTGHTIFLSVPHGQLQFNKPSGC